MIYILNYDQYQYQNAFTRIQCVSLQAISATEPPAIAPQMNCPNLKPPSYYFFRHIDDLLYNGFKNLTSLSSTFYYSSILPIYAFTAFILNLKIYPFELSPFYLENMLRQSTLLRCFLVRL